MPNPEEVKNTEDYEKNQKYGTGRFVFCMRGFLYLAPQEILIRGCSNAGSVENTDR
jgi:hypothetical protein